MEGSSTPIRVKVGNFQRRKVRNLARRRSRYRFAEGQAMRRLPMRMGDWIAKLNSFLTVNDRNILKDAGKISHDLAKERAEAEYEKFNRERIAISDTADTDFDKTVRQLPPMKPKTKIRK